MIRNVMLKDLFILQISEEIYSVCPGQDQGSASPVVT